jgi:hypothetical protein
MRGPETSQYIYEVTGRMRTSDFFLLPTAAPSYISIDSHRRTTAIANAFTELKMPAHPATEFPTHPACGSVAASRRIVIRTTQPATSGRRSVNERTASKPTRSHSRSWPPPGAHIYTHRTAFCRAATAPVHSLLHSDNDDSHARSA